MTLRNMRQQGVHSLCMSRRFCHHAATLNANRYGDDVPPRMVCTGCAIIGADVRPNWKDQTPRESLPGVQGR
jgi:hypothetical protein